MRSICLIILYSAATCFAVATNFSWVVQGENSLELRYYSTETLVRFQIDPQPADPHFDILKMIDGENLVWVGPEDHVWHYGHWFSWKYINGVNFWETNRKTGKSDGLTEVSKPEIQIADDAATITYTRYYRHQADQDALLKDEFSIQIQAPGGAGSPIGPMIYWSVTTTALADVTLDRTPITGEPGGKGWGGYAGLSWRGSKALEAVQFEDSAGRIGMDIHRQRAQWVNATGRLRGKSVGIAMTASIGESDLGSSWYVTSKEKLPFWYINPAILQAKAISLVEGDSFTHKYQVVVHDGSWSPETPQPE